MKFEKGDRVRLSAEGVERHRKWRGTPKTVGRYKISFDQYVARLGTVSAKPRSCFITVLWDGTKSYARYRQDMLEKAIENVGV